MSKYCLKGLMYGLVIVVLLVSFVGCNGTKKAQDQSNQAVDQNAAKKDDSNVTDSKAEEKKRIMFIPKSFDNPFWVIMSEAAKKEAETQGAALAVQAPVTQTDTEKQVQMVENAIISKYDAILLAPSGSKELTGVIKKANDANIPILTIDTRINQESLDEAEAKIETFIGSDNVQAGSLAAEHIGEAIGKGEIAVLEGVAGQESGEDRKKGFEDTIKSKYPDIKIVASQTANWDSAQAYNVTQNILQAHPNIKAVFACNDSMAIGAAGIVDTLKKKSDIIIVGIDGSDEAKKAIKDGVMDGTICQYPDQMGIVAVDKALELLNGGKIDANIPVPVKMLTKENL